MIQPADIPAIFTRRAPFLQIVKERIWAQPCDFSDTWASLKSPVPKNDRRSAAGVLMPLLFRESPSGSSAPNGTYNILLIKRSSQVSQAGDLSFPGGMLNPIGDRILRYLFLYRLLPSLRDKINGVAGGVKSLSIRLITLFMTTALRESWEEIGLSPFRTALLGPLPTYNLTLFKRTIFPLAGFVENQGLLSPNSEVEKIVEIPLASFYQPEALGSLEVAAPGQTGPMRRHPCLIHQDIDGAEEILWGATFYITVGFLQIVMGYQLPEWRNKRLFSRILSSAYLSARPPT
jgi:8-oxo-dGTP pyrophosphatase MutT (NUDIX family)